MWNVLEGSGELVVNHKESGWISRVVTHITPLVLMVLELALHQYCRAVETQALLIQPS